MDGRVLPIFEQRLESIATIRRPSEATMKYSAEPEILNCDDDAQLAWGTIAPIWCSRLEFLGNLRISFAITIFAYTRLNTFVVADEKDS